MAKLSRTKQIIMDWFGIQVHTNFVPKTKGVATIMEEEAFEELKEIERLAEIGNATENAFKLDGEVSISCGMVATFETLDDLLSWHRRA